MVSVNPRRRELPLSFDDLVRLLPPRAMRDGDEHREAVEMIDQLMRIEPLTTGQERYLETLLQLVEAYERTHGAMDVADAPTLQDAHPAAA